jgi:hypothetical protein
MRPGKKGKSAAPKSFSGSDVVVAIDPFTLEVITSRVPQ